MKEPIIRQIVKKSIGSGLGFKFFLSKYDVPIFMFHRVLGNSERVLDRNICLNTLEFELILLFLRENFDIICLKKVLNSKSSIDNNSCIITFDDGWIDNYQFAYPVLKKYKIPATIFLPTKFIGTSYTFWFSRISDIILNNDLDIGFRNIIENSLGLSLVHKDVSDKESLYLDICASLKKFNQNYINRKIDLLESSIGKVSEYRSVLNLEEIFEMGSSGISFGSHGLSHSILTNLESSEKYREIFESKKWLIDNNINYVNCFSFPNGNYDQESLFMAERAGYDLLVSASINRCGTGKSKILAHRINVASDFHDTRKLFFKLLKAKLKGKIYNPAKTNHFNDRLHS